MGWVGFATQEGVRDLEEGQDLITGILTGHYGDNYDDFEKAIINAHENGAKGISFFTAGSLDDKHLAIIKKYHENTRKITNEHPRDLNKRTSTIGKPFF